MVAIKGHFDGKVIVPDEPVDLPVGQRVVVQVEAADPVGRDADDLYTFLQEIAGKGDMPQDWALEHDHYLYGTPKRSERKPGNDGKGAA